MGKHQIELFGTLADFECLLNEAGGKVAIRFARAGLFEVCSVRVFESIGDVVAAISDAGDPSLSFLAVDKSEIVRAREVPQARGGVRFAVDQLKNPSSVVLRPGGQVGENTLVAGQIGTSTNDPKSLKLFSAFEKTIHRQNVKVKSYWIGPEALRGLEGGWRLTSNLRSPPEYDIKR